MCSDFPLQLAPVERTLGGLEKIAPPSNDPLNFILPVLYGAAGAAISASEDVKDFLNKIHTIASSKDGSKSTIKRIIRFLMGHQGDNIDQINNTFINRAGKNALFGVHRLMWGHDIFSIGPDNPFALMIRQEGSVFRGIAQVFRHLTADTFSNQGLPIPFHSYFDYVNEGGALGNRLLDIAEANSNGAPIGQAFGNLFTIKAADVGATGLTLALCAVHNRVMNRHDEAAAVQVKAIAYATQFFGKAAIGVVKTGVPFISWPTAVATVKEIYSLYRLSYKEIAALENVTKQISIENAELEATVFASGAAIVSHADASGYMGELSDFESRVLSLEQSFEG
jgi:hypothetical protein